MLRFICDNCFCFKYVFPRLACSLRHRRVWYKLNVSYIYWYRGYFTFNESCEYFPKYMKGKKVISCVKARTVSYDVTEYTLSILNEIIFLYLLFVLLRFLTNILEPNVLNVSNTTHFTNRCVYIIYIADGYTTWGNILSVCSTKETIRLCQMRLSA